MAHEEELDRLTGGSESSVHFVWSRRTQQDTLEQGILLTRLLQILLFLLLSTASLMFIPRAVRSSSTLSIHFFGCLPLLLFPFTFSTTGSLFPSMLVSYPVSSGPSSGGSRILRLGGLIGRVFLFGGAKGRLSAEGAKLRLPKAKSHSRLGGLGSIVSSPSGVWGGAPETDAIVNISSQNGVHFGILLVSHFKTIKSKNSI